MKLLIKIFGWAAAFIAITLIVVIFFAYRSMTIKRYPTCINYTLEFPESSQEKLISAMSSMATSNNLRSDSKNPKSQFWVSDSASMDLYVYTPPTGATAFLCDAENHSPEWQAVAKQFENAIASIATVKRAYLQLEEKVYKCDPHCGADVTYPVDFAALNNGILRAPKQ